MKETFSQIAEKIPPDIREEVMEDFQDIIWSKTLVDILPIGSPLRIWHEERLAHWSKTFSDPSLTLKDKL